MLSASVLGLGLIHSVGSSETVFSQYKSGNKVSTIENFSEIDVSNLASMLPGVSLRRVPKYAKMGLVAALEAMKNANFQMSDMGENIGLVVGSAFSGAKMNIDYMSSILDSTPRLSSPTIFCHAVNNMGAGLLSIFLNIGGGCQTISQFNLSFAGALQTALLLLHSHKNDYVLLGAIDEKDTRFMDICPQYLKNTPYPYTEGSVFFLLGKSVPNTPQLSISWQEESWKEKIIMYSGNFGEEQKLENVQQLNNESFYGTTPIAHALDTAFALCCETENTLCLCKQKDTMAAIHIWR